MISSSSFLPCVCVCVYIFLYTSISQNIRKYAGFNLFCIESINWKVQIIRKYVSYSQYFLFKINFCSDKCWKNSSALCWHGCVSPRRGNCRRWLAGKRNMIFIKHLRDRFSAVEIVWPFSPSSPSTSHCICHHFYFWFSVWVSPHSRKHSKELTHHNVSARFSCWAFR